jgi:hypothetical protein
MLMMSVHARAYIFGATTHGAKVLIFNVFFFWRWHLADRQTVVSRLQVFARTVMLQVFKRNDRDRAIGFPIDMDRGMMDRMLLDIQCFAKMTRKT